MGGRAFRYLFTPRISQELYLQAREEVKNCLQTLFRYVCVPFEMPSKTDFGDVDFLVAGPLTQQVTIFHHGNSTFDYAYHVEAIKRVLSTPFGRKGYLTERVMYFAIPAPGREDEFWIQIDIKVCEDPYRFEWERFCLNYATASALLGSMVKPLGLTLDPDGLYLRVDGLEKAHWEKSFVFLTRSPKEALKILGMDKRLLTGSFNVNAEIFECIASSWMFNPAHFVERLKDEGYVKHLTDRAVSYIPFVKYWIPENFGRYKVKDQTDSGLDAWYQYMRTEIRDLVLAMYPLRAQEYYVKRGDHLKTVEEERLRTLIKAAIPIGENGWDPNRQQPAIFLKPASIPVSVQPPETLSGRDSVACKTVTESATSSSTFSASPTSDTATTDSTLDSAISFESALGYAASQPQTHTSMSRTPLILEELPRTPELSFVPQPPPASMSIDAKLLCLVRWTLFDASGNPYLACEPREKGFEMSWASSGAEDGVLLRWAEDMWWHVWMRQCRVNYVGMWKRRFEKEDKRAQKQNGTVAKVDEITSGLEGLSM